MGLTKKKRLKKFKKSLKRVKYLLRKLKKSLKKNHFLQRKTQRKLKIKGGAAAPVVAAAVGVAPAARAVPVVALPDAGAHPLPARLPSAPAAVHAGWPAPSSAEFPARAVTASRRDVHRWP